ncbi:MAG: hypothetical protein NZV14_12640 [Bryobacteraceae bacterium]|nr:hypothetical protein [Bryobacteraceae bacterium]MDW8379002.1 hypothetical protein [Bryobacterales bacterium]
MPFCINCGATVEGRFCARCGTAVAGAPGLAGSNPPQAAAMDLPEEAAAALCYLLGVITGVLFLTLEPYKYNRNIRFHAWQSIFLFGGLTALYVAEIFLAYFLPGVLLILVWAVSVLLSFGLVIVWLYLMWKTYNKQRVVLPLIGDLALRQASSFPSYPASS